MPTGSLFVQIQVLCRFSPMMIVATSMRHSQINIDSTPYRLSPLLNQGSSTGTHFSIFDSSDNHNKAQCIYTEVEFASCPQGRTSRLGSSPDSVGWGPGVARDPISPDSQTSRVALRRLLQDCPQVWLFMFAPPGGAGESMFTGQFVSRGPAAEALRSSERFGPTSLELGQVWGDLGQVQAAPP